MNSVMKTVAKTFAAAFLLTVPPAIAISVSATPAFAEKGGNSNRGNSNGNRGNRDAKSNGNSANRGAIASELKGLNAAHASANGLANSSPDSMPGKLYTYQQSTLALNSSATAVQEASDLVDALNAMTEEQFNDLNPDLDYTATILQASVAYDTSLAALDAAEIDADASLLTLTGGRELSDGAMAELQALLGL